MINICDVKDVEIHNFLHVGYYFNYDTIMNLHTMEEIYIPFSMGVDCNYPNVFGVMDLYDVWL